MKRFTATLATVLLSGMAAFAQVPGPQIPLTGSIGVPGSSAVLGYFPVSFTSDANHTLTPTEWANHVLLVTSTVSLTATRNLIAPNNFGQDLIVQNGTTGGQSLQVIASSGVGVTIPNGQSAEVFFDGTNYLFSAGTAAATSLLASTNVWTGASNAFNNGIVTNTATQGISTTNGIVTEMNGITNIYAGTSATSSSGNINSGTLQFLSSLWNGTNTINHTWLIQDILGSGTNPNANLTFTPQLPSGSGTSTVTFLAPGQYANLTAATSGVPTNSPCLHFTGAFFTTSSVADDWCIQNTPNTPTLRGGLTFTYTGSATGYVQVPTLSTAALLTGTINAGTGTQGFSVGSSDNNLVGLTRFSAGTNATSSSGNINSSSPQWVASYWNGTAPADSKWSITNNLGTGTTPSSIFAFTYTGPGTSLVTMPSLSVGTTPSPVCTVATGCGSTSVPAATSSTLGGVILASGQTSSTLSTVATTGNLTDTTGILPSSRIPVNIANGVNFWGNSVIAGTGPQPIVLNYQAIFTSLFPVGPAPQNRTLAGTFSADIVNFGALERSIGSTSTATFVMPSYNAPLNIIQSLENDANFTTAASANQITYTQTVDMALLALATAPIDQWNQVTGNSWTFTGGATPTDEFYGSIAPGIILTTGETASTSITTVAVPGSTVSEPIDVLYSIFASDTGSGTITIDGSLCTDTITGSSTLANAPFGGATFESSQGFTRTLALARCVPTSVGSHSVLVTSVAGGTNGFGLQAIFTSPLSQNNFTGPTAVKVGVLRQQSDTKSTTTALYNTLSINDCNQMLADGFRCINSPAREPYITLSNLSFMMSSTTATQGGAIDKNGMSWTSGNATLTVPSGVDPSYKGKTAICVDGLTASTDLFATVNSVPTSTTVLLSTVSPSAAPGTTVSGTGVCHFGYNDTVTLGSISPGLHPTTAGDDALLRGILSVVQPTMVSPNFQTLQAFNGGIQANVVTNLSPTNLNANSIVPNDTQPTFNAVTWLTEPGGTTNYNAGFGLLGNIATTTIDAMSFSRFGGAYDICDNNVIGSTTNNAFRCGFRFLQATGSAGGLQMPTLSINAAAMTLGGAAIGLSLPVGTVTFTPGTGVTSVTCTSGFTCTNTRGDITIVGATAVVGTIATVNFSAALSAAPGMCTVTQNGGATSLGIGHGAASTTSFAITAGVTVGATTVSVDYTCQP